MSTAPSYQEHIAGHPELQVVEFKATPDAECAALRIALQAATDQRDYWRELYLASVRREELLNQRVAALLSIHREIRSLKG